MLSGHSVPSASSAGEAAGEKAADATSQEGTKSMLVMSGGEGYIDFRMGKFFYMSRIKTITVMAAVAVEENTMSPYVFR